MSIKTKLVIACLLIIFLIGVIVRFYNLGNHPAGFFADEAGLSYNAYLLGINGKDSSGNFLPFYINIFSQRGPVAIYDQIPAMKVFGLTEFGARSTSALLGSLTIITMFLLAFLLFKNAIAGLTTAALTATEPWLIHFSRFGSENIQFPFYFSIFLILFIQGIRKENKKYLLSSLIFMFLSFYTYTASNFFIPIFLVGLLIIYSSKLSKNVFFFITFALLASLIFVPLSLQLAKNPESSRFTEVSVFKNETPLGALVKMKNTYIQSFSPDFLLLKGDIGMPNHFITRFSVKDSGELYLATAPFLIIGILILIYKIKKKENQILLLWLLIYPIGSVMAGADGGGPFATRSIIGSIIFPLITALGFIYFISLIKNHRQKLGAYLLSILIVLLSLFTYLQLYFVEYPKYSLDFWGWQFGARDIVSYFVNNQSKYDNFFMAPEFNAPEIFLKFYGKNACSKCQIGLPEDNHILSSKDLYAIPPNYLITNPKYKIQIKKTIYYPNKQPAFYIGTMTYN